MRPRIGVIGQSGAISGELADLAYRVGHAIARGGGVLLSGGRDGVMAAASRGAREAGGVTVGILPGDDPAEANPYVDVVITTGLGMEWRSLVLVHSSDAIVMLGGGNGTLGELSAAYLNGRPVVILATSGGWAERIRATAVDERFLDHRRTVELTYVDQPEAAAATALALAQQPPSRRAASNG